MRSLRARLLLAATLVLAVFMLLSWAALEQAFRSSAQQGQQDKMQALVFDLLAVADVGDNDVLTIPANATLPDPRLNQVQSGIAALIFDAKGNVIWRSNSFEGPVPEGLKAPAVGASFFTEYQSSFVLSYGVSWAAETGGRRRPKTQRYTFVIVADKTSYRAQLNVFRRALGFGLGVSATALLLLQLLVLRWGLAPLRRLARELRLVESGEQARIESAYPDELTPLTAGLNTMIQSERNQQSRYRNALDDLAHSLKTPLAVLHGALEDGGGDAAALRERLRDPVERIQEISAHQLRKAATAGRRSFAEPVRLRPLVEKIGGALAKVYADKQIRFAYELDEQLRARADEGDLYELLGNLMDNAGKWCRQQIRVSARYAERTLHVAIEDDGPGFPPDAQKLLQRGVRADSHTPGQGIGLGAVAEMAAAYDGTVELGRSELGGAKVELALSV